MSVAYVKSLKRTQFSDLGSLSPTRTRGSFLMSREFLKCVPNALPSSTKVILGFESLCQTYFGDRRPNEEMINLLVEVNISVGILTYESVYNSTFRRVLKNRYSRDYPPWVIRRNY